MVLRAARARSTNFVGPDDGCQYRTGRISADEREAPRRCVCPLLLEAYQRVIRAPACKLRNRQRNPVGEFLKDDPRRLKTACR
jgi:hypothetical protein